MEMDGMVTDIETIQLFDEKEVDYTDLCSSCLVASVEALLEMDGLVTDIDTIQLLDEREVDYIAEDDMMFYVHKDNDFEDN